MSSHVRGGSFWLCVAAFATACGGVDGKVTPDAAPAPPPADAAAPVRCDPLAPFTSVTAIDELNHPEAAVVGWDEYGRLSDDGLTIYFSTGRNGGQLDIYSASRASVDQPFGAAAPVEGVNTAAHERTPTLTADGLTMFAMQSDRPGGYKVVMATRANRAVQFGPFGVLEHVNNASATDGDPYVLPDGAAIYFYSTRGGTAAIYRAPRTATGYGEASPVSGVQLLQASSAGGIRPLQAPVLSGSPTVSADELTMYFWSNRDGFGDIFVATRSSLADGFGAPVQITSVSTAENGEWPTWISPDGCTLAFTRSEGNASVNYNLYLARRTPTK